MFHEMFQAPNGLIVPGMKTLSGISSGPLKCLPVVYLPKLLSVRSVRRLLKEMTCENEG